MTKKFEDKIVVVGTGYVGLPAAIMLAHAGYEVVGVDIDENIVRAINTGEMLIDEDELRALMQKPEVQQNLMAQNTPCPADVFIIAVPTPLDERKKVADLSYVRAAMDSILPHLKKGDLIIIESTIPPLTCRETVSPLLAAHGFKAGDEILLAHCPERILPGNIFDEIVNNDRVIGGVNRLSAEKARELYASFVKGELYLTDDVSAEMCKLMENTYRDVNIALANEFQAVGERLGIDIKEAIQLANRHPRVNILSPGIGVGGHCIPIDPWFIKEVDPENSHLIQAARRINDAMPHKIAAKIRSSVSAITDPLIVAIGATYKPDTADQRESPAMEIVRLLKNDGYRIKHYDPLIPELNYSSLSEISAGADCLALLVEHSSVLAELKRDESKIKSALSNQIILRF